MLSGHFDSFFVKEFGERLRMEQRERVKDESMD
jgi:hypothetical protein